MLGALDRNLCSDNAEWQDMLEKITHQEGQGNRPRFALIKLKTN